MQSIKSWLIHIKQSYDVWVKQSVLLEIIVEVIKAKERDLKQKLCGGHICFSSENLEKVVVVWLANTK